MVDPEDNVKAVLAEVAVSRFRRRFRLAMGWFTLAVLCVCGSMTEVILTVNHGGWWTTGLLATAASALISGVLMARMEERYAELVKARDVNGQWQEEITLQNREVEREHEDGEPA